MLQREENLRQREKQCCREKRREDRERDKQSLLRALQNICRGTPRVTDRYEGVHCLPRAPMSNPIRNACSIFQRIRRTLSLLPLKKRKIELYLSSLKKA